MHDIPSIIILQTIVLKKIKRKIKKDRKKISATEAGSGDGQWRTGGRVKEKLGILVKKNVH